MRDCIFGAIYSRAFYTYGKLSRCMSTKLNGNTNRLKKTRLSKFVNHNKLEIVLETVLTMTRLTNETAFSSISNK